MADREGADKRLLLVPILPLVHADRKQRPALGEALGFYALPIDLNARSERVVTDAQIEKIIESMRSDDAQRPIPVQKHANASCKLRPRRNAICE